MPYIVHEGLDYVVLLADGETTDAPTATFTNAAVARKAARMLNAEKTLNLAEQALGENLVWLSDQLDLAIRQKDAETLRRLKQLNDAWIALAVTVKKSR